MGVLGWACLSGPYPGAVMSLAAGRAEENPRLWGEGTQDLGTRVWEGTSFVTTEHASLLGLWSWGKRLDQPRQRGPSMDGGPQGHGSG